MNQAINVLLQRDAYLGPWSDWSECSIECYEDGLSMDFGSKTRTRNCVEEVNGGLTCSGKSLTNICKLSNISTLGIRGAQGAPLPRLCFAQLALTLLIATVFAIKALCYGPTDGRTNGHPQLLK